MNYIFVNTYTALIQGLYLYKKNSNTILVIDADYFKNSDELMRVLASKKINTKNTLKNLIKFHRVAEICFRSIKGLLWRLP